MTLFRIQILVTVRDSTKREWRDVHPSGGAPYEFTTYREAYDMLRMCYPDLSRDHVRVVNDDGAPVTSD